MKSWLHPPESSSAFWGLCPPGKVLHTSCIVTSTHRSQSYSAWNSNGNGVRPLLPSIFPDSWVLRSSATKKSREDGIFLGRRDILKNQNVGLFGFNPPTWGSSISTLVGKTASKSRVESTFTPFLAASAGKLPWEAPLAKGGLCFSRAPCTTGGKNQIKTNKKMVHHTSQITNIYKR